MDYSTLTGRLSIHLDSIQEGFEELSRQHSIPALTKQFALILSGNFVTTDVNIFFRPQPDEAWQNAHVKKTQSLDALEQLSLKNSFHIYETDGAYPLAFSLPVPHSAMFVVLLGPKLNKADYSDFEKLSLQMFAQLLANAYQAFIMQQKEKELIFSLNHRIVQLSSLVDAGIQINKLKRDGSILTHGLEQAVAMTNAARGRIKIVQKKRTRYICFPRGLKSVDFDEFSSTLSTNFSYRRTAYTFEIYDKESRNGAIDFEITDELLLESISRQVHVALANRELGRQALEKQRIEQEVAVASEVQQELLPDTLPEITGYDVAGINIPSTEVGGDYYDCIPLDDGRYALIVADVTGHGISASLLVNSFHAAIYSFLTTEFTLKELVQKLNKVIYTASPMNKFITAFLAILDPASGEIEYVSAGHNPAYMSTPTKKSIELNAGGIMLGMMGFDIPMASEKVTLEKGQRFLIYTDGIPEADNRKGEMYDDPTLAVFFEEHGDLGAQHFIDDLIADVKKFTAGAPQNDDITALYLIRNA
jgi:sigma-B regulation protein RsbU (phosphoserine phosphatase)